MARKYTDKTKIENYALTTIDSSFDTQVDEWIESITRYIEQYTGRVFIADSTAKARLYDGNDRQILNIDDCVEVTKVEVGNNIWGDSFTEQVNTGSTPEYYTLPANDSSLEIPIRQIGLRNRLWIAGHANHRITAKWGYSATVPEDIELATTILVSGIVNANRTGGSGGIKSEKIGEYSVSYKDNAEEVKVKEILNNYKRYYV